MNSDVVLGEGFDVVPYPWPSDLVFALSRHEPLQCFDAARKQQRTKHDNTRNQCEAYHGSHDAFLFAAPLPESVRDRLDFVQSRLGAENVVVAEMKKAGLTVWNPCREVLTHRLYHQEK